MTPARKLLRVLSTWAIAALWLSAWPPGSLAAEIDSLTGRKEPLRDSTRAIESRLNQALRTGIERANQRSEPCDEQALYRELRRALASPFIGHLIAEELNADGALDKRRVSREESIYRDLGLFDNVSVHWKDLSAVVRLGEVLIGVDKLGHFLVEGWKYFETAYLKEEGIEAAMDWGEWTERSYFGRYTTGVYSYADLLANFEGMRFWARLTGRHTDALGLGGCANRPHVVCRRRFWITGARRWKLGRPIDLEHYVSGVWDEAVNCPSYSSPEIEARVRTRIDALAAADGVDYTCPIEPDACVAARKRYGDFAPRLLHPTCLAATPERKPWWKLW